MHASHTLNDDEWTPPPEPLTAELIQRGQSPVFHVSNEHATGSLGSELSHWSALPALSYFVLNAAAMRESSQRIRPPTRFRPPPRVTLSESRCQDWLADLKNPRISLRKLARTIPHGYSGKKLLDTLLDLQFPLDRAVWFVRCIGSNEVRVLKRKAGLGDQGAERCEPIERAWLAQWTAATTQAVSQVIAQYDESLQPSASSTIAVPTAVASRTESATASKTGSKTGSKAGSPTELGVLSPTSYTDTNVTVNPTPSDHSDIDELFATGESDAELDPKAVEAEDPFAMLNSTMVEATLQMWERRMKYASRLLMCLYNESLVDRQGILDWVLAEIRTASVEKLPCYVHLGQLLWAPLTSAFMAPQLLRTVALRLDQSAADSSVHAQDTHQILTRILEPIVFKLVSTNDNAFVTPRTWPLIEPYVREHPAYPRLVERNAAFMTKNVHDTSSWTNLLMVGRLMSSFSRPYRLQELVNNLEDLDISCALLVKTVLSRVVRFKTTAGNLLCLNLLRRLRASHPNVDFANLAVEFLLETDPGRTSPVLGALIADLVATRFFNLGRYLNRLITQDLLFADASTRDMHLAVLKGLPLHLLSSNMGIQVQVLLQRANVVVPLVSENELDNIVSSALAALSKPGGQGLSMIDTSYLCLQRSRQLAENLVTALLDRLEPRLDNEELFEPDQSKRIPVSPPASVSPPAVASPHSSSTSAIPPSSYPLMSHSQGMQSVRFAKSKSPQRPPPFDPLAFAKFCDLIDRASIGSVRPVARLLAFVVGMPSTGPALLSVVLHQVHARMMAFVCTGFIDAFTRKFLARLESYGQPTDSFSDEAMSHISSDDIAVLRAVIQDPGLMFDFNRLMPMRTLPTAHYAALVGTAGNTPMERETLHNLLHRPVLDVRQLLAMRNDDNISSDIAEYAHTPDVDRLSLLQLIAYSAVSISDIIQPKLLLDNEKLDFDLIRFLLLTPPNELGFTFEEYDAIRTHRHEYLASLAPKEFLELSRVLDTHQFSSQVAHFYPDVFETKLVTPAIESPEFLAEIKRYFGELPSFEKLLITCTPFNLRFRQSLISLKYHGVNPECVANEILAAAYSQPSHSSALQGLLHTINDDVKNLIFGKTVRTFLQDGLKSDFLLVIDVPFNLVGALAASIKAPLPWTFTEISEFLAKLVTFVEKSDHSEQSVLRKALVLILRISVVGRLNQLPMSSSVVPYLDKLLHVEMFADDHSIRTIIEDALRLVLRISQPETSRHLGGDQQLVAGGGETDGLQLYSKSTDEYGPLPVWSFDLIEGASSCLGNDGPVDLSLFEAYRD